MPSVFGYIPSGSRYGNVPNELAHRVGPPFLDNHYRGYQYNTIVPTIKTARQQQLDRGVREKELIILPQLTTTVCLPDDEVSQKRNLKLLSEEMQNPHATPRNLKDLMACT